MMNGNGQIVQWKLRKYELHCLLESTPLIFKFTSVLDFEKQGIFASQLLYRFVILRKCIVYIFYKLNINLEVNAFFAQSTGITC